MSSNGDTNDSHENQRTAVGLLVTLSSQLTTTALALIAVENAIVAYVLSNNDPNTGFTLIAFLSSLFFVSSIMLGGKGISKCGLLGHGGNWAINVGGWYFNWQAISGFLGLILLIISITYFSGTTKKSIIENGVEKVSTDLHRINDSINSLASDYKSLQKNVQSNQDAILTIIKDIEKRYEELQKKSDRRPEVDY
jgi:hypothetical protein